MECLWDLSVGRGTVHDRDWPGDHAPVEDLQHKATKYLDCQW